MPHTTRPHSSACAAGVNRGEVEGRWLEIERVVRALDLFGARTLPALTHGVCDDCHRQVALDLGVA